MLWKMIKYCYVDTLLVCDGNCSKAWGITKRPRRSLSDDQDDYVYIADSELGTAPKDPESYEGGVAKPVNKEDRLNKWCARECERSDMAQLGEELVLPDLENPRPNIPRRTVA